jgi:hypothetical protein
MNCLNLPIVCAFGEARFGKDQEQQRAVECCNQGKSRNIGKIDKKPIASPFKAVLLARAAGLQCLELWPVLIPES